MHLYEYAKFFSSKVSFLAKQSCQIGDYFNYVIQGAVHKLRNAMTQRREGMNFTVV